LPHSPTAGPASLPEDAFSRASVPFEPDPDVEAVWRVAIALDSDDRGPLEAEVLLWRVCSAKSIPDAAIQRALSEEWRFGR